MKSNYAKLRERESECTSKKSDMIDNFSISNLLNSIQKLT